MIRSLLAFGVMVLLLSGCANKRGFSATYYNDCRSYYDMYGYYHETCDPNLIDYDEAAEKTVKAYRELFSDEEPPEKTPEPPKVW